MNFTPFHLFVYACVLLSWGVPRPSAELRFSRSFYNVTIPENSVSRTLVTSNERMGLLRSNTDDDVTFRIISGDPDRIFKVEDKAVGDFIFLVIRTRGGNTVVLNRERKDKFVLIVKAFSTRTIIEATTIIYVKVLDQNDLSPIFVPSVYNTTIPEDFGLHGSVIKVTAEDADQGVNGQVMYWLKEPTEYFAIHPTLGVVTLTKRLKYSERSVHDLTIIAQDRATIFRGGGQQTLAFLSVRVKQVNFYGPEIYVYILQNPSAHQLGLVYAVVRVVDRDEGLHGQIESVRIVDGDLNSVFLIEAVSDGKNNSRAEYNIVLSNGVVFENILFNLTLQVTDKGFPQRTSYKAVSIRVSNIADFLPYFERDYYEINVPEYLPQGSLLIRLRVINRDLIVDSDLGASIIEGNTYNTFRIDSKQFVLYSGLPLDAEKQRTFNLVISMYNFGTHSFKQDPTTKVKVNVIDWNDNSPEFNNTPEHIWVQENTAAGSPLQSVKISAIDLDFGVNGYVTYSIANTRQVPFEIDPLSGVLRTTQPLDFEAMRRHFSLRIHASDSGLPFRRETENIINVEIKNINDNSPEFLKGECSLSIPRNLNIGSDLFYITATDLDELDIITYRLTSSFNEECIKIHATKGMLTLQCDLKEISRLEWSLNITATDGLYKAETSVRVFVASSEAISESGLVQYSCRDLAMSKDDPTNNLSFDIKQNSIENVVLEQTVASKSENMYDPHIFDLPTNIVLNDTLALDSNILFVKAIDKDAGYSGTMIYSVSCEPEHYMFKMDPDFGFLTLLSPLNYYEQNKYILNISVCDQGFPKRCTYSILNIDINDAISKKPNFKEKLHRIHISEDSKVGTQLVKLEALNKHVNTSDEIYYQLIPDGSHFSIENTTGAIFLEKQLDREVMDAHMIRVRAFSRQLASGLIYSDTDVIFYVDDVNDNAPTFLNSFNEVNVREDLPEGSVVLLVTATDKDLAVGGEVLYCLPEESMFSIDPSTGTLRLKGRLDYEDVSEHRVTVEVSDKGNPSLTSQASFTVKVTDVNENLHPPVFDEVVVTMSVRENLPVETPVGSVLATDMDLPGVDSSVTYTIQGGSGFEYFTMTRQGTILTSVILDAEVADHFWLTVVAEDGGVIPLSASVQVYITVLDDNDKLPLTELPAYQLYVEENLPSHTLIGQVTATDDDIEAGSLSYRLSPSISPLPFTIDSSTGHITSTALLDREETDEYVLQVVVTDHGVPRYSSTTRVLVYVADVNDHEPQFTSPHYIAALPHGPQHLSEKVTIQEIEEVSPEGRKWSSMNGHVSENIVPIIQVLAIDSDDGDNGTVTYSLEDSVPFVVHGTTGLIYAKTRLGSGRTFEFLVRACDGGVPSRSSTARVTVRNPHHSNNPRKIGGGDHLKVVVRENVRPGHEVLKVTPKVDEEDQLSFMIVGGSGMNHFAMQRNSLLVARGLDCEVRDSLNLIIRATNLTATWDVKVTVQVQDVNEFNPQFSEGLYIVNVSEATPVGSVLTTLTAMDGDCESKLVYRIHNFQPGSNLFALDSATGELILVDPLDREISTVHHLTVEVSDGGTSPRQDYARVTLYVLDANDHNPHWPMGNVMELSLSEDTALGDHVAMLRAVDRDEGDNSALTYAIISGNKNSTFIIDSELGVLQLTKALDVMEVSMFQLTIHAQDNGLPRLESRIIVSITIVSSERRSPVCVKDHTWVEVSEHVPVGNVIGHVRAIGVPSLLYRLEEGEGQTQSLFEVNPSSGDVLVQSPLDYETATRYDVHVSVVSMAGKKTSCTMTVFVVDYNDNPPTLQQESYSGYVLESAPVGSAVLTDNGPLRILAEDLDTGVNGLLEFTVEGHEGQEYMIVDPVTGVVRTKKLLDYEHITLIEFQVSVHDLGTPSLRATVMASVSVTILDVNDSPPKFTQEVFNATVLLPTDKDVAVIQVTAEDPDSSDITNLKYSLISGNDHHSLTIDEHSGVIYVQDPLGMGPRNLMVKVDDGLHQATTFVHIQVQPKGLSSLRFPRSLYNAVVLENSTKASIVAVVNVLGSHLNEDIRFSILNHSPMFTIGVTSGVISTNNLVFDREQQDCYRLIVEASSTERHLVTHTTVNVSVLDANDNCPTFLNLPYHANLAGNASKGDFIFKVLATDQDVGENGEVRYELDQTGSEMFRIGRKSGEIRLKSLAVLNKRELIMNVIAHDGGIVPCSTSAAVTVSVIDSRAPLWQRTVYTASILEGSPSLSAVPVSLQAISANKVIYQLIGSDSFLLRHDTGVLQVMDPPDRESTPHYTLRVRAIDVITSLSSDTLLLVDVTDINDCYPRFLQDGYQLSVNEDVPVDTNLSTIMATDCDMGLNAVIRYTSSHSHFQLDPLHGVLSIKQSLNYEKSKLHYVTVVASDSGNPPLSTSVTVVVKVLNINDNPPVVQPLSECWVSQDGNRGTFVGVVNARDDDEDVLFFRLRSLDLDITRTFSVDKLSGVITILNPSHLKNVERLSLNISVDDGLHLVYTEVPVRVLATNRHTPSFDRTRYQTVITENLSAGQLVIRVVATDKDRGLYGTIRYSLPPQRSSSFFSISNVSGEIITLQPLDRELHPFHILEVLAVDGGGLRGWTSVFVNVLDENDNPPRFELPQYFACLKTVIAQTYEILKVKAIDVDDGPAATVEYSVIRVLPPHAHHWFHIRPEEGSLFATNPLDVDPQVVTLTLRGSDKGKPPLYSDVTLSLTLMAHDQSIPTLGHSPSRFTLPVNTTTGRTIHHFKTKNGLKVDFRLIGGEDYFKINSSGYLSLAKHPKFTEIKIGLLAETSVKPITTCAFMELSVEVPAFIDHNPTFFENSVELNIPEDIATGTAIYRAATREDSVLFSLLEDEGQFSIDPLTGWLSVTSSLDREVKPYYDLTVVATDTSSSTLLTTSNLMKISLIDINDNPHVFLPERYIVAVREDTPVGSEVVRLHLTDPDETLGPWANYITCNSSCPFTFSPDLQVTVAQPLDRETNPSHLLTVTATDGHHTASALVRVDITDVNDERHHCLHSLYEVSISEAQIPGHLVTSLSIVDPDLPPSSLEYHLYGNGADKFAVNEAGEIRLIQYLDRETNSEHLVKITVADPSHSSWTCSSRLHVVVGDVNDNPPSFVVTNETVTLTEDAAVGRILTKIQVLDFDLGENRRVKFTLSDQSGLFSLSPDSGILTLSRPLQSSPGSVHSVRVTASNLGSPTLKAQTTLQIVVLGMSDDPPTPVSTSLHATVPEDITVGSAVLQVRAFTSHDRRRGTVIYTILEADGMGQFEIDPRTGVLSVVQPLDYERHHSYRLLVLATAVGDPSLAAYSTVNISVTDINDNPPVFKVTHHHVKVREDVPQGQLLLVIEANDVDSGLNGKVQYSLDNESKTKFFIDPYSGVLSVKNSLDREKDAEHVVEVKATDRGAPPLSNTATVTVEVLDVNDNPPVFSQPNATAILQADRMAGWAVHHVTVTDADLSTFPTPFTYYLEAGNEAGMFRIDGDGTLRTTDNLTSSLRLGQVFSLRVRVTDCGDPPLQSHTWVHVKVVEPSKHPPVVSPLRVWVGVYEHQWQGGLVGHVTAQDLDPYDRLEFSIPSSSSTQFTVDPRLGALKVRGSLVPGVHVVNVTVTDGKFTAHSPVTITIEPLSQDMLQTSVYIKLSKGTLTAEVATQLPQFLSTLRAAFLRDVALVSAQNTPESNIGLLISVQGGADLQVVREVMASAGLQGLTPQCACRNGAVCQRQLQMMPDRSTILAGPGLSFVTPGHSLAYYCICPIGYAGEHCEELKCMCPPLQVCVPQRVGFTCMPPCSANQTCPAAMTSPITWSDLATTVLTVTAVTLTILGVILYRRHHNNTNNDEKYGSWGKHNSYLKKKAKLSNLDASKKPSIFTGSPNNGSLSRNNLEGVVVTGGEGETIPLDYLRNINPLTAKLENDIIQGHTSAPDLAICHASDSFIQEDPARDLAVLDEQLSQTVVQYGFPPPGGASVLSREIESPHPTS